jgi:tripartite-type tricarboxylate transporter receptor subunit TctC
MIPDVPTVDESGLKGFAITAWFGLVTRAGAPQPVVEKLNAEIVRILKRPDVTERLKALGSEPGTLGASQFGAFIQGEADKWAPIIRAAGIGTH